MAKAGLAEVAEVAEVASWPLAPGPGPGWEPERERELEQEQEQEQEPVRELELEPEPEPEPEPGPPAGVARAGLEVGVVAGALGQAAERAGASPPAAGAQVYHCCWH